MTEAYALDPYSANVSLEYFNYGPHEGDCVGRRYFWYDPAEKGAWVWDDELRDQHSAISEATWDELFAAAFHRGEFRFLESLCPRHRQMAGKQGLLFLGYQFGPSRASEIARQDPEFQHFLPLVRAGR
jgi:hypothetical protein